MENTDMRRRKPPRLPVGERPFFVYFLRDPRDMAVRYVGISSEPQKRFNNHLHFSFNVPNKPWIDSLKAIGLLPVQHIVLGPVSKSQAERVEARLMRLFATKFPGQLLQRTPHAKSPRIAMLFGTYDVDLSTPFIRPQLQGAN
jgi:hypothetical protein